MVGVQGPWWSPWLTLAKENNERLRVRVRTYGEGEPFECASVKWVVFEFEWWIWVN